MNGRAPQRKDVSEQLVLDLINARDRGLIPGTLTPDKALVDRFPPKVVLAKMQQMADRGVLEVGTSLPFAWIAEEDVS